MSKPYLRATSLKVSNESKPVVARSVVYDEAEKYEIAGLPRTAKSAGLAMTALFIK